ncbi:MAG: hypothetical protein HGA44_15370 [Cellulomonadaceae bacterium]|nr:hypothetical protein [Cellulomonadaceae bacterium]
MRNPSLHTTVRAVAVAGVVAATLAGCGAIQDAVSDEPRRDATSGEIEAADEVTAFALRVGDCLDSTALDEEIETVPVIPCDEPHDAEVYARYEFDEGAYPGEDSVAQTAEKFCYNEFSGFVGATYEDSALDFFPMFPVQDGWEQIDDREVLCMVIDLDGGVTATMAGAAR